MLKIYYKLQKQIDKLRYLLGALYARVWVAFLIHHRDNGDTGENRADLIKPT